jgi:hypothetical protein
MGPVGRYFSESDLSDLIARGHELGCHTFHHCHGWLTPPREYEQSIIANRERLNQILPNARFASHAYPISLPRPSVKNVSAKYYSCARGGGAILNHGVTDANSLNTIFIEKARGNFPVLKQYIDRAAASRSWIILSTHDVCDSPSPFGSTDRLFADVVDYTIAAGLTVLPVSWAFSRLRSARIS